MRIFLRLLAALAVSAGLAGAAAAGPVNVEGGVAIEGYDPVSYFTDSRPVPGNPAITHEWMGATWRFASDANRDAFIADPAKYAPQYGGHCAYGVARGYKVGIDPTAWTVENGRLYLNYNKDVQATWNQDRARHIAAAETNWPGLKDK